MNKLSFHCRGCQQTQADHKQRELELVRWFFFVLLLFVVVVRTLQNSQIKRDRDLVVVVVFPT